MEELPTDPRALVIEALCNKSCVKQDIYRRTQEVFALIKEVAAELAVDMADEVGRKDDRILVSFKEVSATACELGLAGDVVFLNMHTNVFRLDQSNSLWKTSYLQEDDMRGYFGVVNMYNFLSDSLRYHREQDLGYLVARLFINKDGHYFMQGKRQLGFLFGDLANNVIDREGLRKILYSVANYVIEFDLLVPPYDQVQVVSVSEIKTLSSRAQVSTGKRLGFRFQADVDDVQ
ncbi:MAG: hypothetical protein KF905_01085 [Flavobacteriales bacterium]|nr:hypothetical protein [Flavobacteriales bacterium]